MEPKEIIPIPQPDSEKVSFSEKDIQDLFKSLPENIKDECFGYLRELSPHVVDQIKKALSQEEISQDKASEKPDWLKMWEKEDKEDRFGQNSHNREDILELDQITLELNLEFNIQDLFRKYFIEKIMKCSSFDEFKEIMDSFMDSIWSQRGKDEVISLEQETLEDINKRHSDAYLELVNAKKRKEEIEEKIGNRKRIPNKLADELQSIERALTDAKRKLYGMDYEYMDMGGLRSRSLKFEKRFKTTVYFSEYFSAEEYAVLCLERLYIQINSSSRFDRTAHPELLDFLSRFFKEWLDIHGREQSLLNLQDKSQTNKIDKLIERFVSLFQSYERLKDSTNISDSQKDSMTRELPVVLHMLKKYG